MAAELRETDGSTFVVDIECGIDEDWGADATGDDVRRAAHNEAVHPFTDAGTVDSSD